MRANNNIRWEEWVTCDRCGFLHPVSMLTKQLGQKLCKCHDCIDNLVTMRRPKMIADILAQPDDPSGIAELNKTRGEVEF